MDAYRGFVMFLMMAEVLQLCAVAKAIPLCAVVGCAVTVTFAADSPVVAVADKGKR